MTSARIACLTLLTGVLMAGCAQAPRRTSPAPPARIPPPAVANAPGMADAVPREEPRSAAGNPPFYDVGGHRYVVLASASGYHERGVASWYGPDFHGLRTATGERYDMFAMTAAHKTLPFGTRLLVTDLKTRRSVTVIVNDRGPFTPGRVIDLSLAAARALKMTGRGIIQVKIVGAADAVE